jgi:DNA mismatch repair protein MutS
MESEGERAGERREAGEEEEEKKVVVEKEYVVQEHPVLEELKSINVEQISPVEALNLLYQMKKKIQGPPK